MCIYLLYHSNVLFRWVNFDRTCLDNIQCHTREHSDWELTMVLNSTMLDFGAELVGMQKPGLVYGPWFATCVVTFEEFLDGNFCVSFITTLSFA